MAEGDLQDYFDALAYWKRLLLLRVETDELLRRGTKRSHRTRQERLLEAARGQIRAQMRARKRRPFRGLVAVDIALHAFGHGRAPSSRHSVKRYLDAMSGLVYADDRQVAHLVVHRFADDWPGRARAVETIGRDSLRSLTDKSARVDVFVSPARVLARDWERAFRLGATFDDTYAHPASDFEKDWNKMTRERWTSEDEDRLDELLDEARADRQGRGDLHHLPTDIADSIRQWHREELSELLQRRMLDQLPDAHDHPLGADPQFDPELLMAAGFSEPGPRPRWDLPGQFWLPLDTAEALWATRVRELMAEHRSRWSVLPKAFDRPLALDIAAFGATEAGKDLDNLAHEVLAAFESLYCGGRSGTVVVYRAYRRPSDSPGVRVMVMDPERLRLILSTIEEARSEVIRRGPRNRESW